MGYQPCCDDWQRLPTVWQYCGNTAAYNRACTDRLRRRGEFPKLPLLAINTDRLSRKILSFLGAIHWGLEWAGYGGRVGYRRYAIGVVAPAVAWPTMLLPMEYALITQFLAFNFLYFADARATVRGWTPAWYSTYRFVLTFIVGASIVVSLIGRGQIADKVGKLPGPADRLKALQDAQMENLEKEEQERRARMVAKDEEEAEDDDE